MASSTSTTTNVSAAGVSSVPNQSLQLSTKLPFPNLSYIYSSSHRPITKLQVSSSPKQPAVATRTKPAAEETVFFDGGAHYGDLLANLALGFTLLWLPLTLAAVSRAFTLRYRFTDLRVTVISGLTGQDRSDFSYKVIKDVQVVPRLVGEWGDIIITLQDGTKVDLRSVPKFREIAKYCLSMAEMSQPQSTASTQSGPKGFA